jgi:hypothetical protein
MSSIDRQALLGAWKLISIQLKMSDTGEIVDLYGPEPIGACLFDPSGRLMVVITPSGPRESPRVATRSALIQERPKVVRWKASQEPVRAANLRPPSPPLARLVQGTVSKALKMMAVSQSPDAYSAGDL